MLSKIHGIVMDTVNSFIEAYPGRHNFFMCVNAENCADCCSSGPPSAIRRTFTSHLHTADYLPIEIICAEYHAHADGGSSRSQVTLMVTHRRSHTFIKGGYGDPARRPPRGVVIFTSICVAILVAFYGYLAWYLLTSS
jgi:hypothetical protein